MNNSLKFSRLLHAIQMKNHESVIFQENQGRENVRIPGMKPCEVNRSSFTFEFKSSL